MYGTTTTTTTATATTTLSSSLEAVCLGVPGPGDPSDSEILFPTTSDLALSYSDAQLEKVTTAPFSGDVAKLVEHLDQTLTPRGKEKEKEKEKEKGGDQVTERKTARARDVDTWQSHPVT